MKIGEKIFFQGRGNQQNCIGTVRLCFMNLVFLNDKVFSQERKRNTIPDIAHISKVPLKKLNIGQDGNRCSSVLRKRAGKNRWKKIFPYDPPGRRCPLYFCNNSYLLAAQGFGKRKAMPYIRRLLPKIVQR